jgi:tetratricopeptide (TPR) repeat protein
VARRVATYQAGVQERLRRAELDRAAAQVKAAEERKRRKLTVALAAAVLALVTCGGLGALNWQRQRAEQTRQDAELRLGVEAALEKAADLRERARWAEARAVLEQADSRLGPNGPCDLRSRVGQAMADAALVDRLEGIRLKRSTFSDGMLDVRSARRDYPLAFREAGLAEEGEDAAAVAARIHQSPIRAQLVAALDDWAVVAAEPERRAWLLEVARRADPDPWGDRFHDARVWQDRFALEALADELLGDRDKLANMHPSSQAVLGSALFSAKGDALPVLAAAQALHPNDFWLNTLLGSALLEAMQADEAMGYYRAAVALRPNSAGVRNNLGSILLDRKDLDAAIQEYRTAIALDPKYAALRNNLGNALRQKKELDAAIQEYRTAIALDSKYAAPHNNLGSALWDKKELDEAIKEFRAAIALDPTLATPHNGLGNALSAKKELDGAIKEFRAAIALDPKHATPHNGLGNALRDKKELDAAIKEFRAAIALDPKYSLPHYNLGRALLDKKELDAAIQEYRAAVALDPHYPKAHYNLGIALTAKKELDAAIQEYRAAIALDPKLAEAHCNLGHLLGQQGQLATAAEEFRKGHELGSKQPGWSYPSALWVRQAEQLVALDRKLTALLEGKDKPADDAERLALADLCQQPYKQLYAGAGRFYAEAFAHDPKLAGDMQKQHRYNAACAAALAGCGEGKDADKSDDKERARLRQQALAWLRADLVAWTKLAESDKPAARKAVQAALQHWQDDADLAGVRDKDALENLPEAERDAWRKLWDDVAAVRANAGEGK